MGFILRTSGCNSSSIRCCTATNVSRVRLPRAPRVYRSRGPLRSTNPLLLNMTQRTVRHHAWRSFRDHHKGDLTMTEQLEDLQLAISADKVGSNAIPIRFLRDGVAFLTDSVLSPTKHNARVLDPTSSDGTDLLGSISRERILSL